MAIDTWTAYFLASILIALSPGSGAVLAMSHGLSYGMRRTRATIAGLQLGLVIILLVAGAGVGSLLVASELAFSVVKVLGAGYLIYIGWSQWRSSNGIAPDGDAGLAADANGLSAKRRFLTGLLTNLTNPKGILFMVAVLPQFISPSRPLWPQLLVMALTTVAVDTVVMHGYAFAASRLQKLFNNARAVRLQNRVFGGMLMAVGAGLFFVKRSHAAAH